MTRFIDFLEQNTLPARVIEHAHVWLLEHLARESSVLPLRATGSFEDGDARVPAREHRARRVRLAASARDVVFCDNELPVWLYRSFGSPGFFERSLQSLLEQRIAPVADSRAKAEGDGTFHCETVARPWGTAKRHKHIFDAGLPHRTNNSRLTRYEVTSKFLRLVHPVNWFLFPAGLTRDAEQNSAPEYQHVAAAWMARRCPGVFREFVELSRPEGFGWNPNWLQLGEVHAEKLRMPEEAPVPAAAEAVRAVMSRLATATPTNIRCFDIRETATGRFHLADFGVSTGGINRDIPVVFRIVDRRDNVLLESQPTTAATLHIAARGRVDYDRDGFHQRDIVVHDSSNGQVAPASAIGRRIPWKP
ncbi:hypothetical protein [Corallococcus sp. 4LFB]|uniref:hypothetical protein n=1 Tax=Corallococcus sp. 4LFB TaxID=3383249 RepID=UPI003976029F